MMHNVEDVLEILSGIAPRTVNIRLDRNEKSLLISLGRQVNNGVALTDRQLTLALTKISKYKDGLIANSVDVNEVLNNTPLRMPLREIDRSQQIFFSSDNNLSQQRIHLKYTFSKNLDNIWSELKSNLEGEVFLDKNIKSILATESNLYKVVNTYKPLGFQIDSEITEIYEQIEEILENPKNFIPYIDLEQDTFTVKNVSKSVLEKISEKFPDSPGENLIEYISTLKKFEIFQKNSKIIEKIDNLGLDELSAQVLKTNSNRFLINSTKHQMSDVVNVIENLNQWPVLVILEERNDIYRQTVDFYNLVKDKVPTSAITVFFRLAKGQNNADEFNQFVKDNHLNNYIDEKTKIVFITKERIPKPLVKSNWNPQTALVLTNYDYGRIGAFIGDFPTVYYYNNSIMLKTNRVRSTTVVEL